MYRYIYIYIYIHIHACIHIHIYIYIERERYRYRERDICVAVKEIVWIPVSENIWLCFMVKGISEPTFPGAQMRPPFDKPKENTYMLNQLLFVIKT